MTSNSGQHRGGVAKAAALWTAAAAVAIGACALAIGGGASAQGVDLDQVFWCDEAVGPIGDMTAEECMAARQTILSSCTSCHTFAPIVLAQYTEEQWDAFLARHQERVPDLSEAEYANLAEFLKVHYNPDNPQPELPEALRNYSLPPA